MLNAADLGRGMHLAQALPLGSAVDFRKKGVVLLIWLPSRMTGWKKVGLSIFLEALA